MQPHFNYMQIKFADFYNNGIPNSIFLLIQKNLEDKNLPSIDILDDFLIQIKKEIQVQFNINKIDFPYYHYFPNEIYKQEKVLIDVSLNDDFYWQRNLKGRSVNIPHDLNDLMFKYKEWLSKGGNICFKQGYYKIKNAEGEKMEKKIIFLVDDYFDDLKKILLNSINWKKRVDVAFLLGYANKKEEQAIEILKKTALNDKDHAVHNMATRSLFPKICIQKTSILFLKKLLQHKNPYCQNKFLGIAANINLTHNEKKEINLLKKEIVDKTKYSQMIVSQMAKDLMKKI